MGVTRKEEARQPGTISLNGFESSQGQSSDLKTERKNIRLTKSFIGNASYFRIAKGRWGKGLQRR